MAKKPIRSVFYFAMLGKEFQRMKKFLSDDEPVYLTFLNTTNYKGDNKESKIMIGL